jgi:hypothetical protein
MTWAEIPLCWPTDDGACACGRGHIDKQIAKAPLVAWERYVTTPPTTEDHAQWSEQYPQANPGLLLEPARVVVVDCDSAAGIAEARDRGMPRTRTVRTAHGLHFYLANIVGVRGRTTHRGQSRRLDVLAAGYAVAVGARHREGVVYAVVDDAQLAPPPPWVLEMLASATADTLAATPVLGDVAAVRLETLRVSPRIRALIHEGDTTRYPSRSEGLFAALLALTASGYDDTVIANVMLDPGHAISAKPRELGRRWLAREIARARAKSDVEVFA